MRSNPSTRNAPTEGTTHGFYECVITLQDTRKVDCVVYAWEKQGGLSCDWSHVSGADKEPAR